MGEIQGLEERWRLARSAMVEAGASTLRYYRSSQLEVESKTDGSPVTRADREAEELLRKVIGSAFPDDAIVGEEYGTTGGRSGWCWVLDPVDGTKSFVAGVPLFGTMIGVTHEDRAVIGAIWFPALQEGIHAATGRGCWQVDARGETRPAGVSECRQAGEGVLLTTCDRELARRLGDDQWRRLVESFRVVRTWGDVYGYFLVATGRAEVMIDPLMNIWDAAAVLPVVAEAGGRFTDWQGVARVDGGDSVGSNGHLHDLVLDLLRPARA